jgi:hypothetical protein
MTRDGGIKRAIPVPTVPRAPAHGSAFMAVHDNDSSGFFLLNGIELESLQPSPKFD